VAKLTVNLYADYDATTIVSTHTFVLDGTTYTGQSQLRVKPVRQKCTALMAEIIDAQTGASLSLSTMELLIGVKPGKLARLGKAATR